MSLSFQIEARCGEARAGRLITPHGEVETPVFMPCGTLGSVKGVPQEILEELGVEILLGNTYHLYLRPGAAQVRQLGGLHKFMSWERALLTDSGGFQVFSLSQLRKVSEEGVEFRSHLDGSTHMFTPESTMAAQISLGADIIMAFDECTEFPAERRRAQQSMELTVRWAERSKKHFEAHKHEVPWILSENREIPQGLKPASLAGFSARLKSCPDTKLREENVSEMSEIVSQKIVSGNSKLETGNCTQSLFGIVQGGIYTDLRKQSAEQIVAMDFPGYAIGGLSVGEPRALTEEVLHSTLPCLPKEKPRYVMGVGTPEEIVRYALMGVDMMDCVLPTRAARHGLLYTSEGKVNIKNARYAQDQSPLDPNCGCRVCARYTRAYLRHLYANGEVLAMVLNSIHNLAFYLDTMRRVRHSIRLGDISALHSAIQSRA
ncbi:MAG TPA: tRNA guanosine(34) transglycosylase Tgt [Terriglobales bacterium]|nr:tRNA guanosine(34) transglycosylase Tgt [Terriglobales bacterium]